MMESNRPAGGSLEKSTPELTVSMPAFNRAEYIRAAIESALRQEGVNLELIVVDDASDDDTYEVATSIGDPRVRVLRNAERRGIYFCHNRVVRNSRAPFILHLDSDDLMIRPLAFRKLLDLIQSSDDIGQVHAHFIFIDQEGRASWPAMRAARKRQLRSRLPGRDYHTALLDEGTVINYPRLYRRTALEFVGPFNEDVRYGGDLEMAMRLVEHFRIDVVPEALAAVRIHASNTTKIRFRALRFWWQRVVFAERLSRSGQISYARLRVFNAGKGLARILARRLLP